MCKMNGKEEDIESGPNVNEEELTSDEEDEEMEAENEHVGQVIDVAFEANSPSDTDFHGIKRLLQQLFVKHLNEEISELTNLIISQDYVGSVLKQDNGGEDDDDDDDSESDDRENVYNLNTVVNLSQNQNLSCIEKINEFLTKQCESSFKPAPSRMGNTLSDPANQVGLMISERFINIPPQVALPSYESLKTDIETAVRKKKKFAFTHLVLISKTYKAKGDGGLMAGELFYLNPEEKLFSDMCEYQYTFSVSEQRDSISEGQWDDDGGDMESLRTVMVFDASVLGHMINKLKHELPAT